MRKLLLLIPTILFSLAPMAFSQEKPKAIKCLLKGEIIDRPESNFSIVIKRR